MKNVHLDHPFDLDTETELDLFAEEVHDTQRHDLPPNSLSSIGCECGLSTFFCYGCGLLTAETRESPTAQQVVDMDPIGDMETALKWARDKLDSDAKDDKVAEIVQSVFRDVRKG